MEAKNFRIGNFVNLRNWQDEICFFSEFDITQKQIDNLIEYGDGFVRVLSISNNEMDLMAYGYDLDYFSYKEILPIPITPQWIENFGFNLTISNKGLGYKQHGFKMCGFDIMFYMEYNAKPDCYLENKNINIYYIHELQNLFFALTGKELELKYK